MFSRYKRDWDKIFVGRRMIFDRNMIDKRGVKGIGLGDFFCFASISIGMRLRGRSSVLVIVVGV